MHTGRTVKRRASDVAMTLGAPLHSLRLLAHPMYASPIGRAPAARRRIASASSIDHLKK